MIGPVKRLASAEAGSYMSYRPVSTGRTEFLRSEVAAELRKELIEMIDSPLYNTYVATIIDSDPSHFVEKHMRYMSNHLRMDHFQYVQNLRLMTKIRG